MNILEMRVKLPKSIAVTGATLAVQCMYYYYIVHTSYTDAFATQMNMSVEHDIHSSFIASVWP